VADPDDVLHVLRETAYVGVGLGVLAFQRAQVRRRELERALEPHLAGVNDAAATLRTVAEVAGEAAQGLLRSVLGGPGRPTPPPTPPAP
jgi:hypothetical protein